MCKVWHDDIKSLRMTIPCEGGKIHFQSLTYSVSGKILRHFWSTANCTHRSTESNHQNCWRKLIKFEFRIHIFVVCYQHRFGLWSNTLTKSHCMKIGQRCQLKTQTCVVLGNRQERRHLARICRIHDFQVFNRLCIRCTCRPLRRDREEGEEVRTRREVIVVANLELEREISAKHSTLRWRLRCRWSLRLKIAEEKYSQISSWFSWFTSVVSASCELRFRWSSNLHDDNTRSLD